MKKKKEDLLSEQQVIDLATLYTNNLLVFVEDFLPHLANCQIPDFHKEIYKHLDVERRFLVLAPRGFAKSNVCSVFLPIREALFKKKREILIISATEEVAIKFLRVIKTELESNEKIIQIFGEQKSDKWSETHIKLKNGCEIRARGAGAQIRGFRPDLIILDDLETKDSAESKDLREKLNDWIFSACINSLTPKGTFIWIGTVINDLCLIHQNYNSNSEWKKLKFQAYRDGVEEAGYEIWPELWSHELLQEKKKEIGSYRFSHEYMNNPLSADSNAIKKEMIKYWTEEPSTSKVIVVDPAYSEDSTSDYKVAVKVGIDKRNNRYLLKVVRGRMSMGDFHNAIINLYLEDKHDIYAVGLPNSGTEKEFFRGFLKTCEERRVNLPIVEISNIFTSSDGQKHKGKVKRTIAALQRLFESGKYFIHKSQRDAEDELLLIGSSKHDDITDCMAGAEQIIVLSSVNIEEDNIGRYGEPLEEEKEQHTSFNSLYGF